MVDLFGGICLEKLFYLIDQVGLGILLSGLAVFCRNRNPGGCDGFP